MEKGKAGSQLLQLAKYASKCSNKQSSECVFLHVDEEV